MSSQRPGIQRPGAQLPGAHLPGAQLPEPQLRDVLDALAGLVAAGLLLLAYENRPSVPRTLLTLAFACYVPGRAVVSNWPRVAAWSEVTVAMIFSLAILTLLATCTLWAHYWHPMGLFQVEAGLSLAGLALGTVRRHGRRHGHWHGRWLRFARRRQQPTGVPGP